MRHLSVGILKSPSISFVLNGEFNCNGQIFSGLAQVSLHQGHILFNGIEFESLEFVPQHPATDSFTLNNVVIGIGFHWERKENQSFKGSLQFLPDGDGVQAIDHLDVEDYLLSVISSEMSATSSLELLKAHAVISRSWVAAPILNAPIEEPTCTDADVRWFERDAHTLFDVCADDHCQRYQGITRASTQAVQQAIAATRGEVLTYDGRICDARFSKCCGGVAETFENCWAPVNHPYLVAFEDRPHGGVLTEKMDEASAYQFIHHEDADCFCNTHDAEVLKQVLNNYDQETPDFYRWKVVYSPAELTALVAEKSGDDYGDILDLIPVERGISGRLIKLKVVGSKQSRIVGKELEIRRLLSKSHLYSSAFTVERDAAGNFVLTGAGWGHGVGLCQIGAAVMAHKGYGYREILNHYYRGAAIEKRW